MSATKIAGTSCSGYALAQLSAWPSVVARRSDCGLGIGVGTRAGQVLHFHDDDHAALCLTRPVIDRLRDFLTQAGIDVIPDDDWIGMRLETPTDIALLVTLVSVAIKANLPDPPHAPCHRVTPCRASTVRGARRSGRERRSGPVTMLGVMMAVPAVVAAVTGGFVLRLFPRALNGRAGSWVRGPRSGVPAG